MENYNKVKIVREGLTYKVFIDEKEIKNITDIKIEQLPITHSHIYVEFNTDEVEIDNRIEKEQ